MIGIDIGLGLIAVAILISAYRIFVGPTDADRAVGADLLYFGVIGLIALLGVRSGSTSTFDILLIATLVGFLSAISLARALTKGER
ncbi:MAG: monovalent cation/H+ antiporter complex subunit F [Cryobacterium sp.]